MSPTLAAIVVGLLAAALVHAVASAIHAARSRVHARRFVDRLAGSPVRVLVHATGLAAASLESAGVGIDVGTARRWWLRASVVALVVAGLVGGLGASAIAALAMAGAPWVVLRVMAGRAEAGYDSRLAAALDAAARSVRSGASLPIAVGEAALAVRGVVADDLHKVACLVDRGQRLVDALDVWSSRRPRASVRLAAGALALAVETGGPPGRVLDDVATALRQRHQVEREAHALAAQARLSALVVGVAPVAFTAIAGATDPAHPRMLFATPVGLACPRRVSRSTRPARCGCTASVGRSHRGSRACRRVDGPCARGRGPLPPPDRASPGRARPARRVAASVARRLATGRSECGDPAPSRGGPSDGRPGGRRSGRGRARS